MIREGKVHLYTGDGKGKTTAALGLAFRAAGSGLHSLIIQFMKGRHYGELDSAAMLQGLITIEQFGSEEFCRPDSDTFPAHRVLALKALSRAKAALSGKEFEIIILDEIVTAAAFGLIDLSDIAALIGVKPSGTELVLTGRGAAPELVSLCDLVTEMKEVKHYYSDGVQGRRGIEF